MSYKNNKSKTSALMWNEKLELPNGSYSGSDIQYYFWVYHQKHGPVTDNLPLRIYVDKMKNRITFKIKTWYCLELLKPKTMKLLGYTKNNIAKYQNGENVHL